MDHLLVQAYAKLFILILSIFFLVGSIVSCVHLIKKKKFTIYVCISNVFVFFISIFFIALTGIPACQQLFDIKTNNFVTTEGYVTSIIDSPVEKGGIIIIVDEKKYVLIPQNNYGVDIGDYVSFEYGVTSKAITHIEETIFD